MGPEPPKKRGRPALPPGHALGEYLRKLRDARGMTVRGLAKAVGLPETSAGYISQLESGLKAPSRELAAVLAKVLGDTRGIFWLWSMTARRAKPAQAAVARRQLARLLDDPSIANDPHFTHPLMARIETARRALFERVGFSKGVEEERRGLRLEMPSAHDEKESIPMRRRMSLGGSMKPEQAELLAMAGSVQGREGYPSRIPLLPEGMDPTRAGSYGELEELARGRSVRVDPEVMRALRLHMPFAYRLSEQGARRVTSLLRSGDVVILTRETGPVVPHEVYAVRLGGEIVLSLLMFNGRELLLLPDEGEDDFIVVPVHDEMLRHHVIGHVATVIRGARDSEEMHWRE